MGKARTDRNGFTREQRLINENKKLKQALSQLRKQLARIDLDRYDTVKEIIEQHYQEEDNKSSRELLKNLKKTWTCNDCGTGYLEIFVYNRADNTYYYRICSNAPDCPNRTLPKVYDAGKVTGILREKKKD